MPQVFFCKTALHCAAREGHVEVVRALIAAGANINAAQTDTNSWNGMTALHWAAAQGHLELACLLLAKDGIDVNAEQTDASGCTGMTALHWAAFSGHVDVVRALIAANANIHAVTANGITPIVAAFEQGRHRIVALLQQHGAVLPEHYRQARREERAGVLNPSQSTHTASVHVDVATSVGKLKVRYQKQNNVDVDRKIKEISKWEWISSCQNSVEEKNLAYEGFALLIKYGDFKEPRSNITLREALAYVWCGVNDEEQIIASLISDKLVAQDAKVPQELVEAKRKERRETFLNHLYQVYNEYNLDEDGNTKVTHIETAQACIPEAFNKVVETLNAGLDEDVNIRHLTPKVATLKSQGMLFTYWQAHDNAQEKKGWAEYWVEEGTPHPEMVERFKTGIAEALYPEFEDFVSQETIIGICDSLESLQPPARVKDYVASFVASSSSGSSSTSSEIEPPAAFSEPEENTEDKTKSEGKQPEVKKTPLTGVMLERAMRMHRKECREQYQKNLEAFANKALPSLTMLQIESSDDFQDQFVVGGNLGKDFTQLQQLQQPLAERIQAYKKHLPDVLKAHAGYSFEIQNTLRAIVEQIMNKITNEFDTFVTAINEYIENSHRNYGECFMHYCAIQSQYSGVVELDKQLHELLPNIFKALEKNDLEALKDIHNALLPQQILDSVRAMCL